MSKHSYTFCLTGVNIEKVEQKFGIVPMSSVAEDEDIPEHTTKISELDTVKKPKEIVSFLDEAKKLRKCVVASIDYDKKRYKCYWCKDYIPDGTLPIGCPIKFIPSRVTKSYHSEISNEKYTISENITSKKYDEMKSKKDKRFFIEKRGYYETEGVFCSFNCLLAFINDPDNKKNPMYSFSESLFFQLYNDLNKDLPIADISEIHPAPHWKMLADFGGTLSIEKFRESFNKVSYIDHGTASVPRRVKPSDINVASGKYYEDVINL